MNEETLKMVAKARTRDDLINAILSIFPDANKDYLDTLSIGQLIDEYDQSVSYMK